MRPRSVLRNAATRPAAALCVEGTQRVAASSGYRRADAGADALPGSEFQLLVVYQQGMAAHELEKWRTELEGMTAVPATFYPARFSKDEQFGLVGDSCERDGCHAEVHYMTVAMAGPCGVCCCSARAFVVVLTHVLQVTDVLCVRPALLGVLGHAGEVQAPSDHQGQARAGAR